MKEFYSKGSVYRLHTKQVLPISKSEAWDFLSDPANLKLITPDYMGFNILSGADRKMFEGQILHVKTWIYDNFRITTTIS